MSTRTRIFTPCENDAHVFDVGLLLEQLLLFDTVVIRSTQLRELTALVGMLGLNATMWLLTSGAVEIEFWPGGTGTANTANPYDFDPVVISSPTSRHPKFELAMQKTELKGRLAHTFERAALGALSPVRGKEFGLAAVRAARDEFRQGGATTKRAVATAVRAIAGSEVRLDDLELRFIDSGPSTLTGAKMLRAETNLKGLGLTDELAQKTIERALHTVLGTYYRLEEMKFHRAATSFREDEVGFLGDRVGVLIQDADAEARLAQLLRLMSWRNLPDMSVAAAAGAIDMKKFRKVRDSIECIEFRRFLEDAAKVDDDELTKRFDAISTKVSNAVQGSKGKTIRLAVTTIAGVVATGAGLTGTALDLGIDRLVKRNGPAAFLDNLLPSIFKLR